MDILGNNIDDFDDVQKLGKFKFRQWVTGECWV